MNAQLVVSATGKYTTTCRLCQKPIARSAPIEPQTGKRDLGRERALLEKMLGHLIARHNSEFQRGVEQSKLMEELAKEYKPFLILGAFDCDDPNVSQRLEQIRAAIFISVRRNAVSDGVIEHNVASLGLDPDDAVKVNQAMKGLRDACCEFGQFAPQNGNPAQSPISTPV